MPKRPRKSKPEDFNKADSPVLPEPTERESEPNAETSANRLSRLALPTASC
jgi:hypothetical protein